MTSTGATSRGRSGSIVDTSWRKLGRIYVPDGATPWARTHAYVPTPILQSPSVIRLYVAFLDADQVGRVGFLDLDASDPRRILQVSRRPVLDVGEPGMFDDNGVTPLSVVDRPGQRRLYYVGWQLDAKVRYQLFTGLATSVDGGETFVRYSAVPVTDRSREEPVIRSSPHVMFDGGVWKMWYAAGAGHRQVGDKLVPTYAIRYLESSDGLVWGPAGRSCIECTGADEYGVSRPFVTRTAGGEWEMLYSIRTVSRGYRLGYARSADGLTWHRHDERIGLDVSGEGWDSQMICFASLLIAAGRTYLFYNGNGYGETGVGVAVSEA